MNEVLKSTQERLEQVKAERDALSAQVNLLRELFNAARGSHLNSEFNQAFSKLRVTFDATPAQCLAEIRAEAIEDAANYLGRLITAPAGMYTGATGRLLKYAESIRKGGV